jgi:hypothetical protein
MRFGPEQLRGKALLALEEAVQECRYRVPRRSFAIRFALAYLWAFAPADRRPFDDLWRALGAPHSPWSYSGAETALQHLYRALGLERDERIGMELWRRRFEEEGGGGTS